MRPVQPLAALHLSPPPRTSSLPPLSPRGPRDQPPLEREWRGLPRTVAPDGRPSLWRWLSYHLHGGR